MKRKWNVALVGLGFGGAFVPIYRHHPDVGLLGLCDADMDKTRKFQERYHCDRVYATLEEVLADPAIDAVHLVTPIPLHEEQTVRVLESGRHCACTIPMAVTLEGLQRIVDTVRTSGKTYMMMETSVYTTHFLQVREMLQQGAFGRIQMVRGAHYQDMEYWPEYWKGLPPMHYATHAIAPMAMVLNSPIVHVHGFGTGHMRPELVEPYGNPFPMECAVFQFADGTIGEATRALYASARGYTESFCVYGESQAFEWQQIEDEDPVLFVLGDAVPDGNGGVMRGLPSPHRRIVCPNRAELLPPGIAPYTVRGKYFDETNPQLTFEEGGGHGGSHPHLVHEFLSSLTEGRKPLLDEIRSANITGAGICAHLSAMDNGRRIQVPDFSHITPSETRQDPPAPT